MAGFDDLGGLFQPRWFYNSMNAFSGPTQHGVAKKMWQQESHTGGSCTDGLVWKTSPLHTEFIFCRKWMQICIHTYIHIYKYTHPETGNVWVYLQNVWMYAVNVPLKMDLGFIAKGGKLLLLIDVLLIRVRNEWEVVSSLTAMWICTALWCHLTEQSPF